MSDLLFLGARLPDPDRPDEVGLFREVLGAEGLVLLAHDLPLSDRSERTFIVATDTGDGPELACATFWRGASDQEMWRVGLRAPVADVCRQFLSTTTSPSIETLTPHIDVGVLERYPKTTTCLWRYSISSGGTTHSVYLLRVPGADGIDLVAAYDRRDGEQSETSELGRASTRRMVEWASETFAPPVLVRGP